MRRHVATSPRCLVAALVAMLGGATVPLPAQGEVSVGRAVAHDAAIRITSHTGTLRITAWARDSIAVRGRVDPGVGRFYLGGSAEALKLGVEPPADRAADGVADLDVQVPAGARLWIQSSAADIEVTLAGGTAEVVTAGGRVRLGGEAREVSAESIDGNIELALDAKRGRARSASGTIVVRGVIQDLDASTVSGPLLIGMEGKVTAVRLETVSAEIAFKGDLVSDGRLQAETHGGDIELRLPVSLAADWRVVSYGGGLLNELLPAGSLTAGAHRGEWQGRTGGATAVVQVRTFKGRVRLAIRA